jgi:hypothetical protein
MLVRTVLGLDLFEMFKDGRKDSVEAVYSSKMLGWQPPARLNGIRTKKTTNHKVFVIHKDAKLFSFWKN